jgi:UDP-glucose 4-epimerase
MLLGFDPRYQFVHEDDVVGALEHVVLNDLPGTFNVGADGVLAFTEVVGLLGKSYVPVLPPIGTGLAAALVRRLGLVIPPEMLGQLRFGRGMDNRRLKAAGFGYRYTTREAVVRLGEHMRLHPILRDVTEPYRYEEEVEEFLRWSPNVRDPTFRRTGTLGPHQVVQLQRALTSRTGRSRAAYPDLHEEEIIALVDSLEPGQLNELRDHERQGESRERVLTAIEVALARRAGAAR